MFLAKILVQKGMADVLEKKKSFFKRLKSSSLTTQFSIILIFAAVLAGMATYASLTAAGPFISGDPETTYLLLNIDLIILLLLSALILKRIFVLWRKRKEKAAGTRLQLRVISMISLIAIIPSVLMAAFSAAFFYFAIQSWFSERVSTAVNESLAVAEAYLHEHQKVIRADVLAMANDLNRDVLSLMSNPQLLDTVVDRQTFLRNFSEAIVFDSSGKIIAKSGLIFSVVFDSLPMASLDQARQGEVILITNEEDDRVNALVQLQNYGDIFLFVGRSVEPGVLDHIDTATSAVNEYKRLEEKRTDFQILVTLIFTSVALLVVLASILFGLLFARKLVEPLLNLLLATERVSGGDFNVQILEKHEDKLDEAEMVIKAFNKMTKQIETHRKDLIEANRQVASRNYFIEAVFSGVTSGIIGINKEKEISIVNDRVLELIDKEEKDVVGKPLEKIFPQFFDALNKAFEKTDDIYQEEIIFETSKGLIFTLLVRVTSETQDEDQLAVITFDDVSKLIAAQRKAAWSGVAKRIAHEIKNPLTPIQLSAERLKRKYMDEIESDKETFKACTDTIIRQVEEIGRMVNEFAEFSRMPEPVLKQGNIISTLQSVILFHKQAYPDINIVFDTNNYKHLDALFDQGLITQALNNIIKNAIESTQDKKEKEQNPIFTPEILIHLDVKPKKMDIIIHDNGGGLPPNYINQIMEPYVTTKEKGTGLGLAIVKKIMEDHNGSLKIDNRISHNCVIGATVVLTMPLFLSDKQVA